MNRFIAFIVIFLVTGSQILAQMATITGEVVDDRGSPFQGVQVSINKSPFVSTNREGKFQVKVPQGQTMPQNVNIIKDGFTIKKYYFAEDKNMLEIILEPKYKLIRGIVINENGKPVEGVSVLLDGVDMIELATSDAKGNFELKVPDGTIVNAQSRLMIDGATVAKDFFSFKKGFITVKLGDKPLREEEKESHPVIIYDQNNKPLSEIQVSIGKEKYKTNKVGEFELSVSASPNDFSISGFDIEKVDTSDNKITIFVKKQDAKMVVYNSDFNKAINVLEAEKQFLIERGVELKTQIEHIARKLNNDETLTPEQKSRLQYQIEALERKFVDNELAFEKARGQTKYLLDELRNALSQKDSIQTATTNKINEISRQRDAEAEVFRTRMMVATGIVLFLLVFAVFLIRVSQKIRKQKEEIQAKSEDLKQLNKIITEKNQNITDSIRYAQTIQDAILPLSTKLQEHLGEHFVIFKPKDIVSGDFYWFTHLITNDTQQKYTFIAAVDCTGHGVSGAFMSMIGNTLLNEIINQYQFIDTAQVMEMLHDGVRTSLKQEEKGNSDGMDVCLCRLEKLDNGRTCITFTGAKRPLFYYQRSTQQLEMLKGDLRSIGGKERKIKPFTAKEIILEEGDAIYMTSDGFADQNNEDRDKFSTRRMMAMLQSNANYSMEYQRKEALSQLQTFQGNTEQRDDILMIGVRL